MKNIITVFKKEFYRVMSDRRLIFTTILLPGLAIYVMYSFMGNVINNEQDDIGDHEMIVYTENLPNEFNELLNAADLNVVFTDYDPVNHDELLDSILIGDIDLLLRFPTEFETDVDNGILSDVQTYFNPGEKYSEAAYYTFIGYLNTYRQDIAFEKFGDEVQVFTMEIGRASCRERV